MCKWDARRPTWRRQCSRRCRSAARSSSETTSCGCTGTSRARPTSSKTFVNVSATRATQRDRASIIIIIIIIIIISSSSSRPSPPLVKVAATVTTSSNSSRQAISRRSLWPSSRPSRPSQWRRLPASRLIRTPRRRETTTTTTRACRPSTTRTRRSATTTRTWRPFRTFRAMRARAEARIQMANQHQCHIRRRRATSRPCPTICASNMPTLAAISPSCSRTGCKWRTKRVCYHIFVVLNWFSLLMDRIYIFM